MPPNPCDACPIKDELVSTAITTLKDMAPAVQRLASDMSAVKEVSGKINQLSTDMRWLTRGTFVFFAALIVLLLARAAFIDASDIGPVGQAIRTAAIP